MRNLSKLIDFIQFTNAFRKIERAIRVPGLERYENDAEHSYQLALTAWYVIATEKLSLDVSKVIAYALVHDLVETYAGDVPLHGRTEETIRMKKENEHAALERIRTEFSEFPDLTSCIEAYEGRTDEEAKFVYALDKLIPLIDVYIDDGRAWKELHVTFEAVRSNKEETTANSSVVYEYWKLLEKMLRENPSLFPTEEK